MKILYVSNGSNFLGAGGMEYHLIDITNWLEGKGVEIALAVRKGTYFEQTLLRDKPNVYPLSWTGINKIFSFVQAGKAILNFSPDIISINRERDIIRIFYIAKFFGLFLKKKPKIVSVFHNLGWRSSFNLGKLEGILFPNNYIKQDYLSNNKCPEAKTKIIFHGIHLPNIDPTEKLNPNRSRKYFKGIKYPIIGMVGEMRKNQAELIDVAYHLKKKVADFTFAVVGRASEEEINSMKKKIAQRGLSKNFIFTGRVDRKYIPDIFYDFDLSVTTHRSEPFGLVFIESLASYTPLIAYNSGGPVEILEKGGGVLVSGGPEEMAREIASLISDHALKKSMALAGRDVAGKYFSIDAMGQQHYNFYVNIAEGSFSKNAQGG
jgi:glycosyltransferase involved in cell wall biosynthesis